MMKLMFIFVALFSLTSWARGGDVGNGGDAIKCRKDSLNGLEGYYALDYIATLPNVSGDDGLRAVVSWEASSKRLLTILREKSPSLAQSFEHFTKLVYNQSHAQDRVWEPSPFGLIGLDDQRLTSLIPMNCIDGADPQIIQAVIRLYSPFVGTDPGHIVYKYDPALLQELDKAAPLQLSFLLVHEWLWDVSPNVDRNRRVNRFLHSTAIETMSAPDFIAELKGMGLQIPDLQSDEFSEQSCQGYPVNQQEFEERYKTMYSGMGNWGQVTVSTRERLATCSPERADCDSSWKPIRESYRTVMTQYKWFLSPSWRDTNLLEPMKLISPDLWQQSGRPLVGGAGQMACKFKFDGIFNLECSIKDPDLVPALFNARAKYDDYLNAPKIKAVLTHECFRLQSIAIIEGSYVGSRGQMDTEYTEVETVLSVRASGGEFMKPRAF